MATKIDLAVEAALAIANNDAHGYDQRNRWGPDYDCSSLLITAWEQAGVLVKTKYGATRTGNMYNTFLKAGFKDVTSTVDFSTGEGMQKGDVLLKPYGHTEMIVDAAHRLVGAHIAENNTVYADQVGDQTGKEINVTNYRNYPWTYCLRYPGGSSDGSTYIPANKTDVISGNRYLSDAEQQVNAKYIAHVFLRKGWTLNACAAIIGNMEAESNINPGIWEGRDEGNTAKGFGLVQWTPATKLIDWCNGKGVDFLDIDSQLGRILWEMKEGVQYYKTTDYPETFQEFSVSTKSPEYLAKAFLHNYERPKNPKDDERAALGRKWYDYLSQFVTTGGGSEGGSGDIWDDDIFNGNDPTPGRKSHHLPLIVMYLATRRRF